MECGVGCEEEVQVAIGDLTQGTKRGFQTGTAATGARQDRPQRALVVIGQACQQGIDQRVARDASPPERDARSARAVGDAFEAQAVPAFLGQNGDCRVEELSLHA